MRSFAALFALVVGAILPQPVAAQPFAPSIAARSGHVVALRSDGAVFSWGADIDGALATQRTLFSTSPQRIPEVPPMRSVVAGVEHVVALDANGRVWTWGDNIAGQLGVRVQRKSTSPGRVKELAGVSRVAAGGHYSLALKQDGSVWLWGDLEVPDEPAPVGPVPQRVEGLANIVEIAGGYRNHALALRSDGTVLGFGANDVGQLGNGTRAGSHAGVAIPGLAPVVAIAAGTTVSMALTAQGEVWFWGKIGHGPGADFTTPQRLAGLPQPAKSIAANVSGYVVLQDGAVWRLDPDYVAKPVAGLSGIVHVAAEDPFTLLARDNDGRLLTMTDNQLGEAGVGSTVDLQFVPTTVPGLQKVTSFAIGRHSVLATTHDGRLWAWGRNASGSLALGEDIAYSAPRRIEGLPADVAQIVTGLWNTMALTSTGDVWAWGSNANAEFGNEARTPRSVPVRLPIGGVTQVALGDSAALYLKAGGEVWYSGRFASHPLGRSPTRKTDIPPAKFVAAGLDTGFAVDQDGALWAWGGNLFGEVGDASLGAAVAGAVRNSAIVGKVVQVVADGCVLALTEDGSVWAWGRNSVGCLGDGTTIDNPTPRRIAGLSNVVEIAAGLARLADGTLRSWGNGMLARAGDGRVPGPVEGIDSVARIAVGNSVSVAVRSDGTVWAWGRNCESQCASVGDGTFVPRSQPVLVVAQDGRGTVDRNDWFLDLKPGVPKVIPPESIPKLVTVAKSLSTASLLNYDAAVSVRQADQSKTLGLYVVGLVPPAFLSQVPTAPGAHALVAGLKANQLVLVNLTPAGWTVAAGQLAAYSSSTSSGAIAAANILVNVNPATIPGARFCIGYGESAADMLRTETIRDFLALDGAPASALGLPCLLSGVYVDAPPTSPQGSAVPIRAVVVGQSPTGTVRFKERYNEISADVPLGRLNAAVSDASFSYVPSAAGDFAFGATYAGDPQNAPAKSELPVRHVVTAAGTTTTTRIDAPVSSEIGTELRIVVQVSGSKPRGTVQLHRDGIHVGAPAPVIGDQASFSVVGLGIGQYAFTASYSGDGHNQPSASSVFIHKVLDLASSVASLSSSANPVPWGDAVTLTATVVGSNPSGTVTLRSGGVAVRAPVALLRGRADFPLTGLGAGLHVFSIDYSGDASNPPSSSNPLFQQVVLPAELPLSVKIVGTGTGSVSASGSGGACDAACLSYHVPGSVVDLTPSPASGSTFVGWNGACDGSGRCELVMDTSKAVTAIFNLPGLRAPTLSITALDFGGQSMSTTAPPQHITLTNGGTVALAISSITAPANFAVEHGCSTLAPGASCIVSVTYTPGAPGSVSGNITVASNAGSHAIAVTGSGERSLVTHYYRSILGRSPEPAGKAYWEGEAARLQGLAVNVNETWFAMAGSFYASPEYLSLGRDNAGYVADLFKTFFNRSPDAGGLAYWLDLLERGMPRDVVLVSFMFSAEFAEFTRALFGNPPARKEVDTVVDFFRGLLSRLPDSGGFEFWLRKFRAAQCNGEAALRAEVESISRLFIQSPEYSSRNRTDTQYVSDLYNAFLRRGGDLEGVNFWIEQLRTGARSREDVRQQFMASREFNMRVEGIIAQPCVP